MKRLCAILIITFGVFSIYVKVSPFLDNFKVKTAPYWSYVTIGNNPLLPEWDADAPQMQHHTRVDNQAIVRRGVVPKAVVENPHFDTIHETPFRDDDIIIGVYYQGEARAYPYRILAWHEVVNDRFGSQAVTVTLCPYCDTNPVFLSDGPLAASGKVYQSGLVMFDLSTHTLWSQPLGLAIAGSKVNKSLKRIPGCKTTLGQWKKVHPDTVVLSTKTGYRRDYKRNPYRAYAADQSIVFPVRNLDKCSSDPKAIVSYIWRSDDGFKFDRFSGLSYVVHHEVMKKVKEETFILDHELIQAKWDEALGTVRFFNQKTHEEIPSSTAYAFAYYALFQ